jgi:hypothetical protein
MSIGGEVSPEASFVRSGFFVRPVSRAEVSRYRPAIHTEVARLSRRSGFSGYHFSSEATASLPKPALLMP